MPDFVDRCRGPVPPGLGPPLLYSQWASGWHALPGQLIAPSLFVGACYYPTAHPLFHWYAVLGYHLRPMEGFPAPTLYHPEATHEVIVMAMNGPPTEGWKNLPVLHPLNYGTQLIAKTDEEATKLMKAMWTDICLGISPDTDNLPYWAEKYGKLLLK